MTNPTIIGLHGRARCGKDTIADHLVACHGFRKVSFAAPIREMACKIFGVDLYQLEIIKETVDLHIGRSPREIMQTLGTEWGRNIHPHLWLIVAQRAISSTTNEGYPVVVSDVRFENEAQLIRDMGGRVWHVQRPEANAVRGHASEAGITVVNADIIIENCGSLQDLYSEANVYANQAQT